MVSHTFTHICLDICLFFCALYDSAHGEGCTLCFVLTEQTYSTAPAHSVLQPSTALPCRHNETTIKKSHYSHTSITHLWPLEIVPIDPPAVTSSDLYITYSYTFNAETKVKEVGFTWHVLKNRARVWSGGGEAHLRLACRASGHSEDWRVNVRHVGLLYLGESDTLQRHANKKKKNGNTVLASLTD